MDKHGMLGKVILVASVFLFFLGCQEQINKLLGTDKSLQEKIDNEELKLNYLTNRLDGAEERVWKHEFDIQSLKHDVADLDVSDKGFVRIDSNLGTFFLVLDDVKIFADGYKIFYRIGNPYFVNFSAFELEVEWAKKEPIFPIRKKDEEQEDWSKRYNTYKILHSDWISSIKKKKISFVETLSSGTWTKVDMTISPATKDELGYLKLANMNIKQISMRIKRD